MGGHAMSQNFNIIPAQPYIGKPYYLDVNYCRVPKEGPRTMPLQINWLNYGGGTSKPNVRVQFDAASFGQASQPISLIQGVVIDNTGMFQPVSVYFPDTAFTVDCPPDEVVWSPVLTNQLKCEIICQGMVNGFVGTTSVYFTNTPVMPFPNIQIPITFPKDLGNPLIQPSQFSAVAPGFNSRALGDQLFSAFLDTTTAGNTSGGYTAGGGANVGGVSGIAVSAGGGGYSLGIGGGSGVATNVPMLGGSGSGLTCNLTITAGVITAATVNQPGSGYLVGDFVTPQVGGASSFATGSGGQIQVTATGSSGSGSLLGNNTAGLWGTPYGSGSIYLTSMTWCTNGNNTAPPQVLESTGPLGSIFQYFSGALQIPLKISNMNIRLDATQKYRLRCVTAAGSGAFLYVWGSFTWNPSG
jgi:hypothetical protein